jgi:dTDP-4-dehydrorhamnose reductase
MAAADWIAILGSDGQLGAELVRQLDGRAIALSRADCDLSDDASMHAALVRTLPTVVINAAAFTNVDLAEKHERQCMRVNAEAVERLADLCRELDCLLVQISTDYVFGGESEPRQPYREDDAPSPQGVYARSKWLGEQAAAAWEKHLIVRTCGLYGPRPKPVQSNFVDSMLRLARGRDRVRAVNDQTCTPSYVRDIAGAILFLIQKRCLGTYHVANGGHTTWHGFACEIFWQAGIRVTVEPMTTADCAAPAPRPSYSVLDTAKYAALGGPPLASWQNALNSYLRAHRQRAPQMA